MTWTWETKPLPYKSLNGLSEKQIAEHYRLYEGYVKKQNEIQEKFRSTDWSEAMSKANPTYSEVRELKIEESFSLNAIRLHEGYFLGLGGNGKPSGDALKILEEDFGSINNFQQLMMIEGMCARGWVVCAYDWTAGCFNTSVCDAHNLYNLWNSTPVVILDCYEHAYFADYGINRKDYLKAWWANLNWDHINALVKDYQIAQHHVSHRAA